MPQHQFPEKTLLVGFAPLPSSCLLITATILEECLGSPVFAKRNSRGTDPFHLNAGNGFMDFALQSQGYERQQGSTPGEVGLARPESEDGDRGQLDSKADCSF